MGEVGLVGLVAPDDLYLELSAVSPARPWMFGDVISEIPCSRGGAPSRLSMIVTHPCSMRRGLLLRPEVVVAEVGVHGQPIPDGRWVSGFFDLFPLPEFDTSVPDLIVAKFLSLHSVKTGDLDSTKRVASLSNLGVAAVLQRWIHQLSRNVVDIPMLVELIAPAMAEADMQEEWCEAALRMAGEAHPGATIEAASAEFQGVLGTPGSGSYRDYLARPEGRPDVRRKIAVQRKNKYGQ